MTTTSRVSTGILSDAQAAKREEILELLRRAYWMEMETVMSYLANAENLDGVRAEGSQRRCPTTSRRSWATPAASPGASRRLRHAPGSAEFTPDQPYLQPPADATDVVTVIEGVIQAESGPSTTTCGSSRPATGSTGRRRTW